MKRKFTTNSRILSDLFANHINTFSAFCELINNSIQAKAKNIWIDIDYTSPEELHPLLIKKIVIKDDGYGVHINELEHKILDVGTANKEGGKGIGRFSVLQIGKNAEIETIGYSDTEKSYSKATIPLKSDSFGRDIKLDNANVETKEEVLSGNHNTYYQVSIFDLYDANVTKHEPKKKLTENFLQDKIHDSIFEQQPLKIFNRDIRVHINGQLLNPKDFVIGDPIIKTVPYTDKKGKKHNIQFEFFQVKKVEKRKIFLTTLNAGIQTIATGFEYDADWLSPKIGGWFVYISCNTMHSDMYRNIDFDGLDEDLRHYKTFIKDELNAFFKARNQEYDNFIENLKQDDYYPYKTKESSSKSKIVLFDKLAFWVEDEYNLLREKNKLREIVYPLIDRTISNGELDKVLNKILKLNNKTITQFSALLEKTELEDIIEFSDKVAQKMENLEFIEKLVYSEISKNIKERKQLHKILEKMLWIFGEEYEHSNKVLSDKNLGSNLQKLRDDVMQYKASDKDDNKADVDKSIKSITDLFLYSDRIIDTKHREVLVVELKAPKVKISPKELEQVRKYAREIEKSPSTPQNVKFKILLVSSEINSDAVSQIQPKEDNPYFLFENKDKTIEIRVMKWADIIENLKRKLNYMSMQLKIKDVDIQEKASKDFAEIDFGKISSTLKKVKV